MPGNESSYETRRPFLAALLIVVLAFVAYLPSLRGGFILDDNLYVTNSPLIQASDGLYRFWFTTEPVDYWPMTNTTFWLEWRLWEMDPTGYHVANLVLHIAGCFLIWAILSKLAIPGAWLAALLFAVHPVNVESVAWISQRKNVLSLLFFLLSIGSYWKADAPARRSAERSRRSRGWYWLSFASFVLAMLSKGSVAILPFVLLLLTWWQRGEISKRDLVRTAPFLVVAILLAAVNVWFQTHGAEHEIRHATFLQRLLGAGAVVWFYLFKALVPIHLTFVYPQWNIEPADWRWWIPLTATVLVTVLLLWQRHGRYGRPLLFVWLYFCVSLLPVMGFADVGYMKHALVADRYLHIAIIGVVALAAAGICQPSQRRPHPAYWVRLGRVAAAGLVVVLLTLLSWRQSSLYVNAMTLYGDSLARNPDAWILHNNLVIDYAKGGNVEQAVDHFKQALRVNPANPEAYNNFGNVMVDSGRIEEAIEPFEQALKLDPDYAAAHNNLASALSQLGRLDEAIRHYEASLRIRPNNSKVHFNLGGVLLRNGDLEQGISHFEESLREEPDFAEAHRSLANALVYSGRLEDAAEHYERAIQLNPDQHQTYNNLGVALLHSGKIPEAISRFQEAIRLKPDYPDAHYNLGKALRRANRLGDAMKSFQRALELKPDYADASYSLANTLIEVGRVPEAIAQYESTLQLKPDNLQAHLNLAAAYAQIRRFADAVNSTQRALELARSSGKTELALEIEEMLRSYRSMQPKDASAAPPLNPSP